MTVCGGKYMYISSTQDNHSQHHRWELQRHITSYSTDSVIIIIIIIIRSVDTNRLVAPPIRLSTVT